MTETGNTVERLRNYENFSTFEYGVASDGPFMYQVDLTEEVRALIAVVEAAQDARAWAHQDGPYAREQAAKAYQVLDETIDALHSQASDEGSNDA